MYKTLLAAILSSSIFQLFGQFGVSIGHSRPYSYMGVELKTGISGRLLYLPDFDNGLRARFGVTFAGYKPREEQFFNYAYVGSGSGVTIYQGFTKINSFRNFILDIGFDYTFRVGDERFVPYIGLDASAGGNHLSYSSYNPSDQHFSGSPLVWDGEPKYGSPTIAMRGMVGFQPRIGAEYYLDPISLFLEVSTRCFYSPEFRYMLSHEFAFGVRFTISDL